MHLLNEKKGIKIESNMISYDQSYNMSEKAGIQVKQSLVFKNKYMINYDTFSSIKRNVYL